MTTNGLPGSTVQIDVHAPASRGANYCLALSLARRPAIRFDTYNELTMATDALFRATACTGLPGATGFTGQLHPLFSKTSATLPLPSGLPRMRIYVGGVAVNPAFPGGVEPFNVEPIVVQ